MHRFIRPSLGLLLAGFVSGAAAQTPLKDAFKNYFKIGAALNAAQFFERDARGAALIKTHFNSISPENHMKWQLIHPQPERYDFAAADRYVEFGEKNGMQIIGHTLVWHNQTPAWVFQDAGGAALTRDALLARMRDHIQTVVGRYKGRVHGWDVVNEALNEDGTPRQTPWMRIIGEDYLAKAFEYANEADPKAELYYNDYSLENEKKRDGAVELIKKLRARGARVSGIGLQGHHKLDWPTVALQDAALTAFEKLGLKIMITEMDIDVLPAASQYRGADVARSEELKAKLNPYTAGLPEEVQQALTKRYADLFAVYLLHRAAITRITFWGVTDGDTWLNNWPVRGRTNHPLLFDREGKSKPAFAAVLAAASAAATR